MLQVHNNESTECPDCGKALTISNLNKHIKSVHKKMKKTCEICNEEVPYSSISVHKRKVHGIGKSMDDITPRGPNLKLRKRYRCAQKTILKIHSVLWNGLLRFRFRLKKSFGSGSGTGSLSKSGTKFRLYRSVFSI